MSQTSAQLISGSATQTVTFGDTTVASLNGGPIAGSRNAIINGNFDIWQRGTSFTGNEYGVDRWLHVRAGTTHTVTRQPFTLGQTAVPNEPTYFCRTVVTSVAGAGNYALLLQRIEDVRTFAGQQVTVSFWAKVDATKNISVELSQDFGTGGSPSAVVNGLGVTKVSIGTSWQKVTVTTTLPSISGKTLGTDNNNNLGIVIWFDSGSTFNARNDSLGQQSGTFEIAQVQVERGPVATPFERRPIGQELALCQRYYEKSYQQDVVAGTPTTLGAFLGLSFTSGDFYSYGKERFVVTKRAVPAVTLYSTTGAAGVLHNLSLTANQGNAGFTLLSDTGFRIFCSNAAMTTGNAFGVHWIASAEL
jgi:hypothetical protein